MDAAVLIVGVASMIIAGAAAVAALVQARSAIDARKDAENARNEARDARDESRRLSKEANEAFIRQAAAQERANELAEASIPKEAVQFEIRQTGKSRWIANNAGKVVALRARVTRIAGWVKPEEDEPRDVGPGDSLIFHAMTLGGEHPRIAIEGFQHVDGEDRPFRNEITIP